MHGGRGSNQLTPKGRADRHIGSGLLNCGCKLEVQLLFPNDAALRNIGLQMKRSSFFGIERQTQSMINR
jgi:hypothetical protein